MAQFGALVLLFNMLPFLGGAAAADLVQNNLAALHHGALSVESFHSMARSIKSQDGQLAMVEYGENLVRQLRAETANATKHLSAPEETLLAEVIALIRNSMYTSMRGSHDADQLALNDKADDIDACNTNLNGALAGTVQVAETESNTKRSDHITCREQENVLYLYKTGNQTALDTLVGSIHTPAPAVPATLERTIAGVTAYFAAAQPYVDWYNYWWIHFDADKTSLDTATTAHQDQITTCNLDQTAFETKYLLWKQVLEETCSAYCHAAESQSYLDLQSEFAPLVVNRKKAYVAGEILVSKIECLLATNDCSDSTPSADEFTLVPRVPQAVLPCSTDAVTHEVCVEAFRDANYNGFLPVHAQESHAQC